MLSHRNLEHAISLDGSRSTDVNGAAKIAVRAEFKCESRLAGNRHDAFSNHGFGGSRDALVFEFDGPLKGEREFELFVGAAGVFGVAVEGGPISGGGGEQEQEIKKFWCNKM